MKLCSSALPSNGPCRVPRKSRLYLHCPKALHSPPAPVPRRPQSRPVLCIGQLRLSYDFSPSMQSAATPLVLRLRRLTSRPSSHCRCDVCLSISVVAASALLPPLHFTPQPSFPSPSNPRKPLHHFTNTHHEPSIMSFGGEHVWPSNVKKLDWPCAGVTYSYEYHKYIKPEKLARWLETFGAGKGKYVVCNQFLVLIPTT